MNKFYLAVRKFVKINTYPNLIQTETWTEKCCIKIQEVLPWGKVSSEWPIKCWDMGHHCSVPSSPVALTLIPGRPQQQFYKAFWHVSTSPSLPRQGFSSCIGFPELHEHDLGWASSSSYNMNNNITALHSAECAVNLNGHICSPVSLLYCHGVWTEVLPIVEGR